jgi:hypothetical protein
VRRNESRFPEDFLFELTAEEYQCLRSQTGTLKRGQHSKYSPMAFNEQGVAMFSSVLNSQTAIEVNIQIIRVFTKMRQMLLTHKDILIKKEQREKDLQHNRSSIFAYGRVRGFPILGIYFQFAAPSAIEKWYHFAAFFSKSVNS